MGPQDRRGGEIPPLPPPPGCATGAKHREECQVTRGSLSGQKDAEEPRGSGALRKTQSSQEGAQTTSRTRNGQNVTKQVDQGAGLPRESRATKGIQNGKEGASSQDV